MQRKFFLLLFTALICSVILLAQGFPKPQISNITTLPSDPILPTGNCKTGSAGYVEIDGRVELKDQEIGKYVLSRLHDGYIITLYPATKRGIFADLECTNAIYPGAR